MRVRVLKDFNAYWNYAVQQFRVGDELDGDLARHLADNAPSQSVEVAEADPEPEPDAVPPDPPKELGDDDVPPTDGTIGDLMAWVDGHPGRAAAALAAEQAKDKPRSTVVKQLAALAE